MMNPEQYNPSFESEQEHQGLIHDVTERLQFFSSIDYSGAVAQHCGEQWLGLASTMSNGTNYAIVMAVGDDTKVHSARFFTESPTDEGWQHAGLAYWNGELEDFGIETNDLAHIYAIFDDGEGIDHQTLDDLLKLEDPDEDYLQ